MRNITHILNDFPAYSQTFIYQQMKSQIEDGYGCDILADFDPKQSVVQPIVKQLLMDRCEYYGGEDEKFEKIIAKKLTKTDIFHCHFINNGVRLFSIKKKLHFKQPIVITPYGVDIMIRTIANEYENMNAPGVHFVAISNSIKDKLEFLGIKPENITLIPVPLPSNIESYKQLSHKKNSKKTSFLTISRLVEKKGIDISIMAFARIRQAHPDIEFDYQIYGDGPERERLAKLIAKNDLGKFIKLNKPFSHNEIEEKFKETDFLILTSKTASNGDAEGTPTIIEESQAYGIPVIATFHSGIPEQVINGYTGLLARESDIDDTARKLDEAINMSNKQYLTLAKRAREFSFMKFDGRLTHKKLTTLYDILSRRGNFKNSLIGFESFIANPNNTRNNYDLASSGQKYYIDPKLNGFSKYNVPDFDDYFNPTDAIEKADTLFLSEKSYIELTKSRRTFMNGALFIVFGAKRMLKIKPEGFMFLLHSTNDIETNFKIHRFFLVKKHAPAQKSSPEISILMPTYNGKKFIDRAILSAVNQTMDNFEIIIVNDGGEDIRKIVEKYNDSRIRLFSIKHSGKSKALNYAITKARGKYVGYLDDDDYYYPRHLEELYDAIKSSKTAAVYSDNYEIRYRDNRIFSLRVENRLDVSAEMLLTDNYINHQSLLHEKKIFKEIGTYNTELAALIDYDFISRIFINYNVHHLKKIIGIHNLFFSNEQITNRITGLLFSNKRTYQKSKLIIFKNLWLKYIGVNQKNSILINKILEEYDNKLKEIGHLDNVIAERDREIEYLRNLEEVRNADINVYKSEITEFKEHLSSEQKYIRDLTNSNINLVKEIEQRKREIAELEGIFNKIKRAKFFMLWQGFNKIKRIIK